MNIKMLLYGVIGYLLYKLIVNKNNNTTNCSTKLVWNKTKQAWVCVICPAGSKWNASKKTCCQTNNSKKCYI